jgi:DNA replication and repair protein RecF
VVDDVPPELRGVRVEVGAGIAVVVKDAIPAGEGSGS